MIYLPDSKILHQCELAFSFETREYVSNLIIYILYYIILYILYIYYTIWVYIYIYCWQLLAIDLSLFSEHSISNGPFRFLFPLNHDPVQFSELFLCANLALKPPKYMVRDFDSFCLFLHTDFSSLSLIVAFHLEIS